LIGEVEERVLLQLGESHRPADGSSKLILVILLDWIEAVLGIERVIADVLPG
jgi:hypothetical protein